MHFGFASRAVTAAAPVPLREKSDIAQFSFIISIVDWG
jgi:hypothetical protein